MRPPDEKKYVLVTQKTKLRKSRSLSVRDYSLPKPYRKAMSGEERRGISRMQVALLAVAGMLIAGLIATLALLAHENVTTPRPKPIVAMSGKQAGDALLAPAVFPGTPPGGVSGSPALAAPFNARAVPPPPRRRGERAQDEAATAAPAAKEDNPLSELTPEVSPDPDVVLLTAILMLTPPPVLEIQHGTPAICTAASASAPECSEMHGMDH